MFIQGKKVMSAFVIVMSLVMLFSSFAIASSSKTIKIDPLKAITVDGGKITGTLSSDKQVAIYKGIPFAASPVGDLRWKAPQPVKAWSGVKSCTKFSSSAMQQYADLTQPWMAYFTPEFFISKSDSISEDCLYLNVWTKSNSIEKKRPVIVYIHGGGFGSGSAAIPVYDGEAIAKKNVVYVGINYRLGIFGFLTNSQLSAESKDGISGNYGILDQIAALKWVRNNIAKFGGDPENVTIMGQSAGGMSVDVLSISPYAKGLFKNAVCMSGSMVDSFKMGTLADKQVADNVLFEKKSLKDMRAISADDLLKIQYTPGTCMDGKVIPGFVADILKKGTQNKVNLMTGFVTGDGPLFGTLTIGNAYAPVTTVSKTDFEKAVQIKFGAYAQECIAAYPVTGDALSQYNQINLDVMMMKQHYVAKLRALKSNNATYIYSFDHSMPGKVDYGAFHTAEVPYFLGDLGFIAPERKAYFMNTDYSLSNKMMTYLVNFAKTGNPNGAGLDKWNVYDGSMSNFYMGDNTFTTEGFDHKKIKFWQDYYNNLLGIK